MNLEAVDRAVARELRRRRSKRTNWLVGYAFQIAAVWLAGWPFMLAVGNVHEDWIRQCPTIGYGKAVLLVSLLAAAAKFATMNFGKDG